MSQCEAAASSSQVNPQVMAGKKRSPWDEVLRPGARQLLVKAVEAEVTADLEDPQQEVDEDGRRLVVRNGHAGPCPLDPRAPREFCDSSPRRKAAFCEPEPGSLGRPDWHMPHRNPGENRTTPFLLNASSGMKWANKSAQPAPAQLRVAASELGARRFIVDDRFSVVRSRRFKFHNWRYRLFDCDVLAKLGMNLGVGGTVPLLRLLVCIIYSRNMAEREGFEPSVEFPLHTLSKRAPSATRPSLRGGGHYEPNRGDR